jgi:hypothetical protein
MKDIVEIKSKIAMKWIKENWQVPITSILYDRNSRLVILTFKDMKLNENKTSEAKYPILNSTYKDKTNFAIWNTNMWAPTTAMEPFRMVDSYHKQGFIIAPGHTPVSICGLKICLKDIGIKTKIKKIQKPKTRYSQQYNRSTYKIYPKTEIDYACFLMYFSEDIDTFAPTQVVNFDISKIMILPKAKTIKGKKKNDKTK